MWDRQGTLGMHGSGAGSVRVRRQVPSGKREFWYVDRRMLSSRQRTWCCLFFQGLLWLWQDT